ncbi:cysteine hydrolase family protein [Pseudoalteromonas denitrificans]|uniref:Nicotinamidase-related amidase n=1 Tax=Pseudoalteromonas denitrificans DSM 6059 TaxID=1123010 RepID=A0A1I1N6C4_9GAMM|nr:cysteine hydrolase family protein [Pseudoalteromonas denitrificans]SFC92886.1 Nicotinamidase-related amidase [Pseudoalteromonas denitrificans DSM 6059]
MNQLIIKNVMKASQQWIASFNQGDVQACIKRYSKNATMQVHPFGQFNCVQEISDFWLSFATKKPSDLIYRNVEIKVLNDKQAVLSANWSMNIASGFISKELWTLADNGQWYLEQDDFTVLKQLETPLKSEQRTALVLVDLQNDYFESGRFELENINSAANKAKLLLENFREQALPVIHIQHIFKDSKAAFFTPNSPGIEIHSSVKPLKNEVVIVKHQIDSFINTPFEQSLIELGIQKLIIVGAMAQACVQTICRSATNKGYECEVIEDAIAAPKLTYNEHQFTGDEIVAANLLSLSFGGATINTSETYLKGTINF